ncbi:hypothetical protein ANCCEY_07550 [Ancylostoma ceylanicum]|uniref:Uncharacterized protein n=1 Tax=Ancylostoma ceylanicum TaxID=53326 RepID=A0A0D6LMU0_9BILA|nr:hypothetical protein ANCCEY_07550 [Ancylostoma ceylanicum]
MGVRVDCRVLHHLRFANDIVYRQVLTQHLKRWLTRFEDFGRSSHEHFDRANICRAALASYSSETYADRLRRRVWKDRSPNESDEYDVQEERMGPGCLILAQRNDHIRTHQLRREVNMMNDLAPELGRRKARMNGMKPTIITLCILICSSAWALPKKEKNCYAVASKNFMACEDDSLGTHTFNKTAGKCVPCCNCFGSNSFKTKQECESFCK